MANEEIKQRIIDFFKQSKGKSKYYLSDLVKCSPDLSKKELKKVTTEMIVEGTLMYYSTGSTTMLQLPDHQIYSAMQAGKKFGMQTMTDGLYQVYVQRLVSKDECLRVAPDKYEFLRMIGEKPLEEQAIQMDRAATAGRR